jgi:hypothetical protein
MKHEILAICTAYEQGYGHGYERRNLTNPYKKDSDEWHAWDHGYSEGNRKWVAHSMQKIGEAKAL